MRRSAISALFDLNDLSMKINGFIMASYGALEEQKFPTSCVEGAYANPGMAQTTGSGVGR